MSKKKTYDLIVKDGKEKRTFRLSAKDFERFLSMFEENEMLEFDLSNVQIQKVASPWEVEE